MTRKKTGSEREVSNGGNYEFIGFGWETVEIANHGDRSLVINGVSSFGHAVFASPAPDFPVTVLPGETFSFGVTEMASPGDTRITIDSNDPDTASFLIRFDGDN